MREFSIVKNIPMTLQTKLYNQLHFEHLSDFNEKFGIALNEIENFNPIVTY